MHRHGVLVVAALFDTDRAPYVIRKGEFFEVPWREGAHVRSARRADLLRILVPLAKHPKVDVRVVQISNAAYGLVPTLRKECQIGLYVVAPVTGQPTMLPLHRCSARVRGDNGPWLELEDMNSNT